MYNNTKLALWSLANRRNCRIENDKLYDDDLLIFVGVGSLVADGYVDTRGVITDLGRRVADRPLSSHSIVGAVRKVKSGEPISRYLEVRLVHEGVLEWTPGGALRKTELKTVTLRVTEGELILLKMMKLTVVSER